MKKVYNYIFIFFSVFSIAQKSDTIKTKLKVFGSFENNSQWYTNDKNRKINADSVTSGIPLRSNNYLNVNANYGRFTFGTQLEAYYNEALLNYNPLYIGSDFKGYNDLEKFHDGFKKFEQSNLATYYANYKSNKLDVTLGHYYVQFGSGMALRTWEDRPLGINNALRGGKIVYTPVNDVSLTALYGKTRSGFNVVDSNVFGFNADLGLSNLLKIDIFDFKYGFSAVGRYEELPANVTNFEKMTNIFSNRFDLVFQNYYFNTEYVYKTRDAIIVNNALNYDFAKEGSSLLVNFGYSKKGFGIDASLRRVENMSFLAQRSPTVFSPNSTSINFNDKILNFVPSLTKQHHSNLANIYVYQAQFQVVMDNSTNVNKVGEIGGQIDVFYEFKKGSKLGGKYGTKVNLNLSSWFNLDSKYRFINSLGQNDLNYKAKLFGSSDKYFSDYNIEITKKFSPTFKSALTFINQQYNNRMIQGLFNNFLINSQIIFSESSYQISKNKSITFGLEHMWADNDRKNWAGGSIEYNHNKNWSIFAFDMYNYGFDKKASLINKGDKFDIHFYNFGAAFKSGSTRIALNYGRQRGGLVCAGGVCRFVPPSSGLGLQITTSF